MMDDEFRSMMSALDFCDVVYMVAPKRGLRFKANGAQISNRGVGNAVRDYPYISTSEQITEYYLTGRKLLLRHSAQLVPGHQLDGDWPSGFHFGPFLNGGEEFVDELQDLTRHIGCTHGAEYYCSDNHDSFVGVYALFSKLSDAELQERVSSPWVSRLLELTHFYMTRTYPSLTRPEVLSNLLKERTLRILELTALGKSCREIGEELFLTQRGVNYHIEMAKELLQAKNKIELIRIAKDQCLI